MRIKQLLLVVVGNLVLLGTIWAAPPIPSTWQGELSGTIHGVAVHQSVVLELQPPLPYETNPFHLFLGTATSNQLGDISLVSAAQFFSGGTGYVYDNQPTGIGIYKKRVRPHQKDRPAPGTALVQYLTLFIQGEQVVARLTDTNSKLSAAANTFTGPNVSALEASPVMRSVMQSMGATEMFLVQQGAELRLRFDKNRAEGSFQGIGRSVINTSSDVLCRCTLHLQRVQ